MSQTDYRNFDSNDRILMHFFIKSVMLFPENDKDVKEYMLAQLGTFVDTDEGTKHATQWFNELGGIGSLAKAKSVDELNKSFENKQSEFETVKMLVSTLFRMKQDDEYAKVASVNKAAFLLDRLGEKNKLNIVKSEKKIKAVWSYYKPVAHIVTAKKISDSLYDKKYGDLLSYQLTDIDTVFVVAEKIADFLTSFKLINSKDVFVARENLRQTPIKMPEYTLCKIELLDFGLYGGLSAEEKEILKSYTTY